jgi:hypothetical protein
VLDKKKHEIDVEVINLKIALAAAKKKLFEK